MSHHSSDERVTKVLSEAFKKTFGEFPNGRMNERDEGAIPIAIGHENGRVTIQFARNLNFVGFTADQAIDVAQLLIENARICGSSKQLTVKIS